MKKIPITHRIPVTRLKVAQIDRKSLPLDVYTDIRTVNRALLFTYTALYEIALALEEESFKLVEI